ncbi:hypothetical protein ACRQGN_03150 [Actinotignum sp. GS-2025b]|uniref:hypothetical protein n=1 Tax=Actinotignum sp. GS-2025b TaxID=3427275 RepID=UPI003F47C0D3
MTSSRVLSPGVSAAGAASGAAAGKSSGAAVSGGASFSGGASVSGGASPAPLISAVPRELVSLICEHEEVVREVEAVTELAGIQVARGSPKVAAPPAVLELEELPAALPTVRARFHPVLASYFPRGSVVLELPRQAEDLLELVLAAGQTRRGRIIGLAGVRGGLGVSMITAWLASLSITRTAVVDADPLSAGLEILMGFRDKRGVRWADIAQAEGTLIPQRLRAALPSRGQLSLLSADVRGGAPPNGEAVPHAIDALSQANDTTYVDLPRSSLLPGTGPASWRAWCDAVVLVSGVTDRDAQAIPRILRDLGENTPVVIAARCSHKVEAQAFGVDIGQEVVPVRRLRGMDEDLSHGVAVGEQRRSVAARDITQLAAHLDAVLAGG